MHIAYTFPQDMAFEVKWYRTHIFNGEGGTAQRRLKIEHIYNTSSSFRWGSVWVLCNDILAFFGSQQLTAVVSVHIMVDF